MVNELFLQVAVGEGGFRGCALEIAAIWCSLDKIVRQVRE